MCDLIILTVRPYLLFIYNIIVSIVTFLFLKYNFENQIYLLLSLLYFFLLKFIIQILENTILTDVLN